MIDPNVFLFDTQSDTDKMRKKFSKLCFVWIQNLRKKNEKECFEMRPS